MILETSVLIKKLQEVRPKTLLAIQLINKELICTAFTSELEPEKVYHIKYEEDLRERYSQDIIVQTFLKEATYTALMTKTN